MAVSLSGLGDHACVEAGNNVQQAWASLWDRDRIWKRLCWCERLEPGSRMPLVPASFSLPLQGAVRTTWSWAGTRPGSVPAGEVLHVVYLLTTFFKGKGRRKADSECIVSHGQICITQSLSRSPCYKALRQIAPTRQ